MELLIAAVVTLGGEIYKKFIAVLNKKDGVDEKEIKKFQSFVLLICFLMTVVGVVIYQIWTNTIDLTDAGKLIPQIWGTSMLYYEVIIKRIIKPIFNTNK